MIRNILLLLLAGALSCSVGAQTSSWPSPHQPMAFINPFPLSEAEDAVGRTLAQQLSTRLNDPIVVDNCRGAGGTVGAVHHSIVPSMYVNLS